MTQTQTKSQLKFGPDIFGTSIIALFGSIAAYGATVSLEDPTMVIAAIYGILFIGLAWRYPHMALGIALAVAPFQNDVSAGFGPYRMSMGEISVSLCFMVYLLRWMMRTCEMKLGPYLSSIILYLAVCLSSSFTNWSNEALTSLLQMLLYFIVTPLVYCNFVKRLELLTITLYMNVVVCLFLAVVGLSTGTFFIFGLHKNGVGSSLAMGIIICTELFLVQKKTSAKFILFFAEVILVGGLVFSLSRGAWLGAMVGFMVVIGTRGKLKFMAQALLVIVPLIIVFWNLLPEEKREYASSFDTNRQNISARYESIDYARNTFMGNPIFGVGVALRKNFDATNIFWVILAETGVQGLITFSMIHFVCLSMIAKTRRFVSRTDPRFSLLVLGGALLFAKVIHGIVDHYWSRGALLVAWAGCGMATSVYFSEQNRLARANIRIMKSTKTSVRPGIGTRTPGTV